jgi:hypothetical protein
MAVEIAPTQVAEVALLGQMTTGFPVSPLTLATYLIVGLAPVDLADHQRFSFGYLFSASVLMTLAAVALVSSRFDQDPFWSGLRVTSRFGTPHLSTQRNPANALRSQRPKHFHPVILGLAICKGGRIRKVPATAVRELSENLW